MPIKRSAAFTLVTLALAMAGCSSPPKAPTVDDSNKRPVNVSQAIDLQMCRAELSAAKVVLTETVATNQQAAFAQAIAAPTMTPTRAVERNQVFIINFALGSAEFSLPDDQRDKLIEEARNAKFIVIRGRTDAQSDSLAETRLAQRRTEAAYNYLVRSVRMPPNGIRLSWQGAGDRAADGDGTAQRQANRRVEIELYPVKPETDVLTGRPT
jgi:outer membrane protein OmpA-like peptidoglycan-associated protein